MMQEFVQRIKESASEAISDIHTAMPGVIQSVDIGSGTCSVLPSMMRVTNNGDKLAYPTISGVPIVFPQGDNQKCAVSFPVKSGDSCLLIIAEQSLDYWMYGRETDTNLKFDITNAMCIPGMFTSFPADLEEACSESAVIVTSDSTKLKVAPDKVTIIGDLKVEGKVEVTETIDAEKAISSKDDVMVESVSLKEHKHDVKGSETDKPKT